MCFKNIELRFWNYWIFFTKKHVFLWKNKATEVISFAFSNPNKEKLISWKRSFISVKDSIDQEVDIT